METIDNLNPVLQPANEPVKVPEEPYKPKKHYFKKLLFVLLFLVIIGVMGLGAFVLMQVLKESQTPATTSDTPTTAVESTPTAPVGINSAYSIKIDADKLVITEESTGKIYVVNKPPTVPVENFENDVIKSAFNKTLESNKVWSNNKTKFAFLDTHEKGKQEVMILDNEKKTITQISDAKQLLKDQLVWSPEDNKIAYLDFASFGIGGGYYASIMVYDFITEETQDYGEYNAPLNIKWADNNHISFDENNASGTFKKTISLDQTPLKFITIPIYQGSLFVKKEVVPPPCDEPVIGNCDYVSYQLLTPTSFDKVLEWYKSGESGWILGSNIVVKTDYTEATITNNKEKHTIRFSTEGTSTKIVLLLQTNQKNLEAAVREKFTLAEDVPVRIIDYESTYAYGFAGFDQSIYWYGAKAGDNWVKVVGGNDIHTCTDAKFFPIGIFGNKFDKCYEGSSLIDRNAN